MYRSYLDKTYRKDRSAFFAETDKYDMISYFRRKLTDKQYQQLEEARQDWRDMTKKENYPDIDYPPAIPDFIDFTASITHVKNTGFPDEKGFTEKADPDFPNETIRVKSAKKRGRKCSDSV